VTANAPSQFAPQSVSTSADAANLITLGGETYRAKMKNIEEVRRDDLVLAKNPETGELAAKRVERNFERVTDHLRILRIRNADGTEQTIETTNEHPFWILARGWVEAGKLGIGDIVTHADGLSAELLASTYEPHPEGIPVYNFEVADLHNYFVSASPRAPPVLVHNDCETVLYRILTEADPLTNLLSHEARGLASGGLHSGISAWGTLNQAMRKASFLESKGHVIRGIAELRIPRNAAEVTIQRTLGPGHHTVWGAPQALMNFWTATHFFH
jgi:hypothetical protein